MQIRQRESAFFLRFIYPNCYNFAKIASTICLFLHLTPLILTDTIFIYLNRLQIG